MTQKTISLSEKAYGLLKSEKKEGESFSEVIERLLSQKDNPWLTMQNQFDQELWEGLKEKISKIREENLTGKETL
jgi:predicted CopG family antitoxin